MNPMRIKNLITRLQKAIDAGLTHVIIEDNKIKVMYPDNHLQDLAPILSKEKYRAPKTKLDPMHGPDEPVHSQDHWHDIFEQKDNTNKQILNEEITRIKKMMNKITNESFDDDFVDDENELDYVSDDYNDVDDNYQSKDYDSFSPKLKHKQIKDRMKMDVNREPSSSYLYLDDKEERDNQRKGLPLKRDDVQPEPYNPIQSTDIPLEKYLAIKQDAILGGHKKLRYNLKF